MSEIDALLREDRTFDPSPEFRASATVSDPEVYARAAANPEAFWEGFARELEWIEPWSQVLDWQPPHAKWFVGGKLNVSANCLDRHVRTWRRNKAAFVWEGEPGDRRILTYFDLYRRSLPVRQRAEGARRSARAIASRSTCRSSRSWPSRCWPARGSARSTRWSSAASPPSRCAIASTTRRRELLITADGGYRRGADRPAQADGRRGAARNARRIEARGRRAAAAMPTSPCT